MNYSEEKYRLMYLNISSKTTGENVHEVCGICCRIHNAIHLQKECKTEEKRLYWRNMIPEFVKELNDLGFVVSVDDLMEE